MDVEQKIGELKPDNLQYLHFSLISVFVQQYESLFQTLTFPVK